MVDYAISNIDAKDNNKLAIAKYLTDRTFADSALDEACKKENKTLDGVMKYITQEAKKLAVGGCAMVEDSTVYEWAVHYILEDSLDCEKKEPTMTAYEKYRAEHPAPILPPTPPKNESGQLTFDF